jgi:indole-3-glycerol phosphate synthase
VTQAMRTEPYSALERRARRAPLPPPLKLSNEGFDVIAELKLRSPSAGLLKEESHDWLKRVADYAYAGAAAVSVLTEPTRFDGSLEHLRQAARRLAPLGVPAMRKDFLVDPYQVLEARCAGAGGVLLILRMLEPPRTAELLAVAAEHGLFVLLEAFDAQDLALARDLLVAAQRPDLLLVGVNCRDLATLKVDPKRFAELAPSLPPGAFSVVESGVATAADARTVCGLGYRLALVGTALMQRDEPAQLISEILEAARAVKR